MRWFPAILALMLGLQGCAGAFDHPASDRPAPGKCRVPVVKLSASEYDDPDYNPETRAIEPAVRAPGGGFAPRYRDAAALATMIETARFRDPQNGRKAVLVLSGGSQHGAFGAGLLYGWAHAGDDPLPTYAVVTGVSTGALQSTYAFLANSGYPDDPAHRANLARLAAFRNGPGDAIVPAGTTWLGDLARNYMPNREADILAPHALQTISPNGLGFLDLVDHPSLATFAPLRATLLAEIDRATFVAVAHEADRHRRLFVGIADLVNEYGYAADLTRLAQLAVLGTPGAGGAVAPAALAPGGGFIDDIARLFPEARPGDDLIAAARTCYVDALLASSSVPPGVPPISIEIIKEAMPVGDGFAPILDPATGNWIDAKHAFIDGGASFAVFISQLQRGHAGLADPVDLDLIVNGSYFPTIWDRYRGAARVNGESDIANVRASAIAIAEQSASVLQDQIRIFSVGAARRWVAGRGRFRWAFISDVLMTPQPGQTDKAAKGPANPGDFPYTGIDGTRDGCDNWRTADQTHHPMEFDVTYMRCMIAYGADRGGNPAVRWNLCADANGAPCVADRPRRNEKGAPSTMEGAP